MSNVPDNSRISRYVKRSKVRDDDQGPLRVDSEGYTLRENEAYASVNDLDLHQGQSLNDKVDDLQRSNSFNLTTKPRDVFAIHTVKNLKDYVVSHSHDHRKLDISHQPLDGVQNCSHSGIFGYKYGEYLICETIVDCIEDVIKVT